MKIQLIMVLTMLLCSSGLKADEAEARAILDRAIEAIGGDKKLSDLKGGVWKTNGTVNGKQSQANFHGELPGKFRIDSIRVVDGQKVLFSRIVNGDKGWIVEGPDIKPMSEKEIAGVKASFYHKQAVTTLIPLRDKESKLTVVGPQVIDEQPATQIKVSRKGFPDLLIAIDDATGLVVRSEMKDVDSRTGKDRKVEIEWRGHKEFDGIKMASRTKTYHDGKLFIDTEITDFKKAQNLPAAIFDPKK